MSQLYLAMAKFIVPKNNLQLSHLSTYSSFTYSRLTLDSKAKF